MKNMYKHPVYGMIPIPPKTKSKSPDRRRPMTDWQKKKLEFYQDERKWHRDIKSRVIAGDKVLITDGNGNIKEVRD